LRQVSETAQPIIVSLLALHRPVCPRSPPEVQSFVAARDLRDMPVVEVSLPTGDFAVTAQAPLWVLILILVVTFGLSLAFCIKPAALRACDAMGRRELDRSQMLLLKLLDIAIIMTVFVIAFASVVRWSFHRESSDRPTPLT
jgi:hypothetical protein